MIIMYKSWKRPGDPLQCENRTKKQATAPEVGFNELKEIRAI